jgi:hypothetical protein
MIFQSWMGPKNQGVTIPNGTTQENSYPKLDSFKIGENNNTPKQKLSVAMTMGKRGESVILV